MAILGAVFVRNESLGAVRLDADDFFDPRHRVVFRAMRTLAAKGSRIDPPLVCSEVAKLGPLAGAVGIDFLSDLVNAQYAVDNIESYADVVRDAAITRTVRLAASEVLSAPAEGAELLELARRQLGRLETLAAGSSAPAARRAVDLVDDIIAEAALPWVSTGIASLDERLGGGLRAKMLHLLVAGTGKGKTSLAVQMNALHSETGPSLYYSGELTGAQLAARVIAQRTGASWRDVMKGQIPPHVMRSVLGPLNLRIIGRCPAPITALRRAIDAMLAENAGVPFVVVDYAQLIADIGEDNRLAVMAATRELLAIAESKPIVLLVLSQGSRASSKAMREGSGSAEDYTEAGAETSELEKSAGTMIVLVYATEDGVTTHEVTAMIPKGRMSGSGRVGLRFHGPSGRWEDLGFAPVTPAEQKEARVDRAVLAAVAIASTKPTKKALRSGGVPGHRGTSVDQAIKRLTDAELLIEKNEPRKWSDGRVRAVRVYEINPLRRQEVSDA